MCQQCIKNTVYEFTNQKKLCKGCFIKYFQKKFLYTIRKFSMIKKGDVVSVKRDNNFRNVVLGDLLRFAESKMLIKLSDKKPNKIALFSTLDSESDKIVHNIIKENIKKLDVKPVDGREIKPLYLFLDEEVLLYAKLRKLKFGVKKQKKDKISLFINDLERKHPEIKRAIVNSYLELYE